MKCDDFNPHSFPTTENEPKKVARVMFDFQAVARNELAVKKGDLVLVRRTVNHNWVEVEDCSSGLVVSSGHLPLTLQKKLSNLSSLGFRATLLSGPGAAGNRSSQV